MAFIPTPNGIQVKFVAAQNGIPVINVWHVKSESGTGGAALSDVAGLFLDWWRDFVRGGIHASYVLSQVIATDISVEDGEQFILNVATDNVGLITSAPTGAGVALVMSWRTAQIGRSFRGRTYIGGLPNAALVNAQTVDSTYAGGFLTAGVELIDTLAAAGYVLSVLSKVANGVARVAGLLTEIIAVIVNTKVDSQRKRNAN